MTRAAIYLRVSTTAQAGEDRASLPIQLRDCTAYCERQGWQVVATEEDHETGKNITRKGYQAILQLARDHAIDHIVVWAPERFGRNRYYKTDEEYLHALGRVLKDEYEAIVEAGFVLQLDCPDLGSGWNNQFRSRCAKNTILILNCKPLRT